MNDYSCGELTWMAKDDPDLRRVDPYADIWSFASSWVRRLHGAPEKNVMERFIYLWVTVNAWAAMAVADRARNHMDTYLVHSLAIDSCFNERFSELLKSNIVFNQKVIRFIQLLPVFKVLWIRNVGLVGWEPDREVRAEFVKRAREMNPIESDRKGNKYPAFAPVCAFRHIDRGEAVPADWPHVISSIYMVRCNLFHGGKDYQSERDRIFVSLASEILWTMWRLEIPKGVIREKH
ncbi:MAG: hypothetical protein IH588_00560 [Anaerolineales bacterium]|nr:hypothetical protein [Anaerolineales bacterium]